MNKLIWICGGPGVGKSTLLYTLKDFRPDLACFDADSCRAAMYPDMGFADEGRLANVKILTELACQAARYGADSVVAAVTPTDVLRDWVEHRAGQMGVELHFVHLVGRGRQLWAGSVYDRFKRDGLQLDMSKYTPLAAASEVALWFKQPARQLFVGRWQPFHTGHQAIILEALEKGPVAIGVRQTAIDEKNPAPALERMACIREEFIGDDVEVFLCPDIDSIHIGRDVGYEIVQHAAVPGVSGTELRANARREND